MTKETLTPAVTSGLEVGRAFQDVARLLTRHRRLTWELAKREVSDKYTGQMFGALWAIGHPLIVMLVYVFVFGTILRVRINQSAAMPLDYTAYLLAGLIPWLSAQEALSKATTVVVGNANLVKQVVFPLEVLPAKGVIATVFTELVFLALLMGYTLIRNQSLSWMYALLPVLIALQVLGMIGLSYLLSAVGVYLRDTKDFVQVFLVIGVYLVPAFYLPSAIPRQFQALLLINPFSHMIWCFQDVLYYGRFEHPWSWPVFAITSLVAFMVGAAIFRRLRTTFGNVL